MIVVLCPESVSKKIQRIINMMSFPTQEMAECFLAKIGYNKGNFECITLNSDKYDLDMYRIITLFQQDVQELYEKVGHCEIAHYVFDYLRGEIDDAIPYFSVHRYKVKALENVCIKYNRRLDQIKHDLDRECSLNTHVFSHKNELFVVYIHDEKYATVEVLSVDGYRKYNGTFTYIKCVGFDLLTVAYGVSRKVVTTMLNVTAEIHVN